MSVVCIKKILVRNLLIYIPLYCVSRSSWIVTTLATLRVVRPLFSGTFFSPLWQETWQVVWWLWQTEECHKSSLVTRFFWPWLCHTGTSWLLTHTWVVFSSDKRGPAGAWSLCGRIDQLPRTMDTRWLNPYFFAAQIQIQIPNKYLV